MNVFTEQFFFFNEEIDKLIKTPKQAQEVLDRLDPDELYQTDLKKHPLKEFAEEAKEWGDIPNN